MAHCDRMRAQVACEPTRRNNLPSPSPSHAWRQFSPICSGGLERFGEKRGYRGVEREINQIKAIAWRRRRPWRCAVPMFSGSSVIGLAPGTLDRRPCLVLVLVDPLNNAASASSHPSHTHCRFTLHQFAPMPTIAVQRHCLCPLIPLGFEVSHKSAHKHPC
jgi:hypothetical protein